MICSKITKNIVNKYKTAQKYCNSTIYKLKTFIISLAKILLSTVTTLITNKQQFAQISSKEIDKNPKTTSNINYYETFKTFIYSTIITVLYGNGKG